MLYNELDVMEYAITIETEMLEGVMSIDDDPEDEPYLSTMTEAEADEVMSELDEDNTDIDGNRKPVFFRGKFTTIDPFWESKLEDEVWGTTFDKMLANFHKQVEYHVRTAKTYGHITPEKAARLAYETLEILEYYE